MHLRGVLSKSLPVMAVATLALAGCRDDFGGYYDQPSWVEKSSAEVLQGRSDCKTYQALVEKTLFYKQLEGSGQYTFIVPTDKAFSDFFANNPYGYKSVDDIPADVAARMVSSWMLYNSYPCDSISNVLSGFNDWTEGGAFKHQTPSYDVLRKDVVNGKQAFVYETLGGTFSLSNNAPSWNNYRWLPVFTQRFLSKNSITSADWSALVGSSFSQYGNYLEAGFVDTGSSADNAGDLFCQNGVIHLVDKVVMPLDNMDAIIRTYGEGTAQGEPEAAKQGGWGLLNKILNHKLASGNYQFLSYTSDVTATHYFEKAYPDLDMSNLQLRNYNSNVNPFLLNVEAYTNMAAGTSLGMSGNDLHYNNYNGGMTFYVPAQAALKNYIESRLFSYVGAPQGWDESQEQFDAAFNKLSDNVLPTLWQALQSDGTIWPSQFSKAENAVGQTEHIDGYDADATYEKSVLASGFASNGLWNIIKYVPKTAAFEGVASRYLLDPAYSYEEQIITTNYARTIYANQLASKLSGKDDVDMTMILWGDDNARWWDDLYYNGAISAFVNQSKYNAVEGTSTSATTERNNTNRSGQINQNVTYNYIEREKIDALDLTVDPLNGAYGGWAYTNTMAGGVVRYRMSGNTVEGQPEIQLQSSWNLANDVNERAMYDAFNTDHDAVPALLQQTEPTANGYVSLYKDPSYSQYINGNVYMTAQHSVPTYYALDGTYGDGAQFYAEGLSKFSYLRAYLVADSLGAREHTIFKQYFDFANEKVFNGAKLENVADGTASLNIGSGFWTIFIPTDEAMQWAIDNKLIFNINNIKSLVTNGDANYIDSCCYMINAYITKNGCYPDDGLSAFYEPTDAWDGIGGTSRVAATRYLISTNNKMVDLDKVRTIKVETIVPDMNGNDSIAYENKDVVVKAWEALISGANMSAYVEKAGAQHELQYTGRPYTSGAFQCVDVYNANDITGGLFDNTVIRKPGKSNIICQNGVIHALNGFVIYKIAGR